MVMNDAFSNAVTRIEQLLDREADLLEHRDIGSLCELNVKKSQGLVELSRAMQSLHNVDRASWNIDPAVLLSRLRDKLETNRKILDLHLRAAREVSLVIARAIEEQDSDGTYGAGAGRADGRR
jgi:hypothetical protein